MVTAAVYLIIYVSVSSFTEPRCPLTQTRREQTIMACVPYERGKIESVCIPVCVCVCVCVCVIKDLKLFINGDLFSLSAF